MVAAAVVATIAVALSQSAAPGPGSASAPLPAGALAFRPIDGAELLIREQRDGTPSVGQEDVAALAGANADFALDVYRQLAAATDENVIVGPHSISSALAMIYVGARGETATEMAEVLHFDSVEGEFGPAFNALDQALQSRSVEGAVDLRIANQGFGAPGLDFLDSYLATLGRDFGAPMAELDFADAEAARRVINGWAADRTNDRIEELFPSGEITPQTVLVVANAVSLDAEWRYKFSPSQTTDQPFFLPDGSSVRVPTMRFDLYLPLVWTEEYAAVELLYGRGDLSMVLLTAPDFESFEAELDPERLNGIFDSITEQGIHLSLPKFSFKSHTPTQRHAAGPRDDDRLWTLGGPERDGRFDWSVAGQRPTRGVYRGRRGWHRGTRCDWGRPGSVARPDDHLRPCIHVRHSRSGDWSDPVYGPRDRSTGLRRL